MLIFLLEEAHTVRERLNGGITISVILMYFAWWPILRFIRSFTLQSSSFVADEIDNQVGEIEYEDGGLIRCQIEEKQELVEMTELPFEP